MSNLSTERQAETPKIVKHNGYSFDKAIERSKTRIEYWKERCDLLEGGLNANQQEIADLTAELAEYERQLACGELVPVDVVMDYNVEYDGKITTSGLKQFAAERQKKP